MKEHCESCGSKQETRTNTGPCPDDRRLFAWERGTKARIDARRKRVAAAELEDLRRQIRETQEATECLTAVHETKEASRFPLFGALMAAIAGLLAAWVMIVKYWGAG